MSLLRRLPHLTLLLSLTLSFFTSFSLPVFADSLADQKLCSEITDADLRAAAGCTSTATSPDSFITTIVNTLLLAVGFFAVIMIIFSGFQIITSAGNSTGVQKGKKTLIYALVGLVVSLSAYLIINYVLDLF